MRKVERRTLLLSALGLTAGLAGRKAFAAGDPQQQARPRSPLMNVVARVEQDLPTAYYEAPMLADLVKDGKLPPVSERLPKVPLVADLKGRGREGAYDAVGDDLEDILSTRHEEVIEIVEHYTFGKQER